MVNEKILILKTGYAEVLDYDLNSRKVSLGDVLRTTPILHLFEGDHVSWATDSAAMPLLEGNPLINRLMAFDQFLPLQLENERFDTVINLEKVPGICAMTNNIQAWKKYGFRFDPETGRAEAYNHAFDVLAVGADPKTKRSNVRTAQELLFSMLGKVWSGEEYILGYFPDSSEEYDVSFNVLVGQKWPNKAWPKENWDVLESLLVSDGITLTRQDKQDPEIFSDIKKYIDWVNKSRLMVTNDSLGLHLSLALKKKVLGLFGPTPQQEVHFYGRGKAILPEGDYGCLPCFEPICKNKNYCMEGISPEKVYQEIKMQLMKND